MRYLQVLLALVFCSLVILWSLSSVSFENGKLFTTKISKEDIVSKEALKIQRDYPIDDCNNSLTIFDDDLYFHFHSSCEDTQTLDEISNQFKSILEKHFDKKKLSKFKIVSIELQNKYFHNVHFIRYDNTIKHDAFILDVRRYYNDNEYKKFYLDKLRKEFIASPINKSLSKVLMNYKCSMILKDDFWTYETKSIPMDKDTLIRNGIFTQNESTRDTYPQLWGFEYQIVCDK